MSAGFWHSCGVRPSGSVECWGWDTYGEASPPSDTFAAVSTFWQHTCGVTTSGNVECWGEKTDGQCDVPEL